MKQPERHLEYYIIRRRRTRSPVVWYRFVRKTANLYRASALYMVKARCRFLRRLRFRLVRLAVFAFFRIWIDEAVGLENIPTKSPAIFVSNHLSYYDFLIFGSILRNYIVFLAQVKVGKTLLINWFTKFHTVVYVDRDQPGASFFKKIIRHLDAGKLLVIYPEGTRSRTGKMLKPKPGFVKLAMKASVPIIPVAMKGTYEILPPHRHIPKLRKCKVFIGEKMYISPENPHIADVFFKYSGQRKYGKLTDEDLEEIAVRIMEKIRLLAGEEWDDSAVEEIGKLCRRSQTTLLEKERETVALDQGYKYAESL